MVIDQIRETVIGPRAGSIIAPESLMLSETGTSTRIRSEVGLRLAIAAVPTPVAAVLMDAALDWAAPAMPQIFDNSLLAVPFTIAMIVLCTAVVARAGWNFATDILHGPKGPGQVWVPEELHDQVESAISHLRQGPRNWSRDLLINHLENTLRITKSAIRESLDDPSVIIHIIRWSGEHIEKIDAHAQYLATHQGSGFTAT
ncbi:hypothetical protein [Corynebacterium sp.]|uniref:hypothetical protein n=1 Tax=Corynebacterium sp. TaxID=1720 RepID=UPI0028A7A1E2|nr:hypothetical protein [Corynebacterium sp.]